MALRPVLAAVLAGSLLANGCPAAAEMSEDEYVFRIAGCTSCHTREEGPFLGGGPPLETAFGTFYAPNITSDPEHGIGRWSEEDLAGALRRGVGPDGVHYYPVFPYASYTAMTDEDVARIHRHLATTPPSDSDAPAHDVPWFLGFRILNWFWKLLFFEPGRFEPESARSEAWNRGAYLSTALAHCEECHSPRNLLGAVDESRHLAGNPEGPDGQSVPNITPHEEDGIGPWSPADIAYYLTSGALPDGDYAGGAMAEVIYGGLEHLTRDDARAIAEYLRLVPPLPSR